MAIILLRNSRILKFCILGAQYKYQKNYTWSFKIGNNVKQQSFFFQNLKAELKKTIAVAF